MRGVHAGEKVYTKTLWAGQTEKKQSTDKVSQLWAVIIGWVILCFLRNQLVSLH